MGPSFSLPKRRILLLLHPIERVYGKLVERAVSLLGLAERCGFARTD
jgi:hypothetical protein